MKKHLRYAIFLLHACILLSPLHAGMKNMRFRHISIEDGLSQNSVMCILQDDFGFIWIATRGALNKYDGYSFSIYKSYSFDSTSLSENHILSMCKDHAGVLWIGTEEGLNRFNYSKNNFTQFFHHSGDTNSISSNTINALCEDAENELWIGTSNGLTSLNRERNRFVRYYNNPDDPNSLGSNDVRAVYCDKSGALWIGTYGGGLNKFDPAAKRFRRYMHDPAKENSISDNHVLCLCEDHNNILWIGTERGGLNRLDAVRESFFCYKSVPDAKRGLNDNHIKAICEDRSGRLWIGTYAAGVTVFDPAEETFYHCRTDPDGLKNTEIFTIFEDNTNCIWIGGNSGGLNIYNQEAERFIHYKNNPMDSNSLSDNMIWQIIEDNHTILWIGTDKGGLNKLDREKNLFTHYTYDEKNPHSICAKGISRLYEDGSGALWIGTDDGLGKFDRKTGRFVGRYAFEPDNPYSLSHNKVRAIYEDRRGTLWIGTRGGGLNRLDRKSGRFFRYTHDPADSFSISSDNVYCLHEDRAGNFWVGTRLGGLNRFDRETGRFFRYLSDRRDTNTLSHNYILAIHEDKSGILWIGTWGGGLSRFDPEKGTCTHFTEKDGLSNNEVYAILEDGRGNLWMSTNRGISRFNPATKTFKVYLAEDGLQSNEFNSYSAFKNSRGELFFGGINGFNAFLPDSIKDNPVPPSVVITAFKIANREVPAGRMADGRTILQQSISQTEEIVLSYRDRVISFEFAALHYVAPAKNQCAYMMQGLEKEWNHSSGNVRSVTYSNLRPGKYVFKVKGSNNDGIWNEQGTSLKITILPPFWSTVWFRLLCLIIIVVIVIIISRYQINKIKKKKEDEARQKVIADVGQVLEHGMATIYRRGLDKDVYDYIGNGIQEITGYNPAEFTLSLWKTIVIEEELTGEFSGLSIAEAYKRMRDGSIDSFVSDFKVRTKSGEVRWARDITTVLHDESGKSYACLGIIFDITDRKLFEQKLAETSNELRKKNRDMEADLYMAREVQSALLSQNYPRNFPVGVSSEKSVLQFSHRYIPASVLGGDFFEIIPVSDHEIGILIYDVMGHGVRASLITAYLHGLIEELAPIANDTAAVMQRLNLGVNVLINQIYGGIFTTAFYLVADIKTGRMHYSNAGHPPPYIIQKDKNNVRKIESNGRKPEPALGFFADYIYTSCECPMAQGDIVFFYTDGLYEVEGENKQFFGMERLLQTINTQQHQPPEKMLDGILGEINRYTGTREFRDDVCMVTMQVKEHLIL